MFHRLIEVSPLPTKHLFFGITKFCIDPDHDEHYCNLLFILSPWNNILLECLKGISSFDLRYSDVAGVFFFNIIRLYELQILFLYEYIIKKRPTFVDVAKNYLWARHFFFQERTRVLRYCWFLASDVEKIWINYHISFLYPYNIRIITNVYGFSCIKGLIMN